MRTKEGEDERAALEIIRTLLLHGANPNGKRERYDWRGCGDTTTAFQMALDLALHR